MVIVFDLMVDFMRQNLKKSLPAELYMCVASISLCAPDALEGKR